MTDTEYFAFLVDIQEKLIEITDRCNSASDVLKLIELALEVEKEIHELKS